MTMDTKALKSEIAAPALTGFRQAWVWRPLASLTPAQVAEILRRAALGDAHDFLIAAADIEEKDLHYRAVLQTRKLAVAGLPWDVQPADESRAAKKAADLTRRVLESIDLPELAVQMLDALSKGYAVAEIIWQTDGPTWTPAAILPREPHWFRFDSETGRELRLFDGTPDGAELPPYKFLCHTPRILAGIPIMGGLARSALWAWVFKSYALRDWAAFAELYGQPIRLGKYGPGATREDIAVLKRAVFELGSDAGAVIPESMALEIVESGAKSASADLYQRLIEYLDRQVSKAVLGQTLTTDQGSSGSLAQARVHDEVRADLIRADARALAATLTRDLIESLIALNMPDAPLPKLRLVVEEPEDMAALADQLSKLVPLGMPIPQSWVREKWGIPEAAPDEPVLGATAKTGEPNGEPLANQGGTSGSPSAQAAHAAADVADPTPIDPQTDRMDAEAAPAWAEIMDGIKRIVDEAQSMEQLRDALLAAYGDLSTDRLTEVMAMGFAAADLAGRFDVRQESAPAAAHAARPEQHIHLHATLALPEGLAAMAASAPPPVIENHIHVPESAPPVVNVDVAAPAVTVTPPAVQVDVAAPAVTVQAEVPPAQVVVAHPDRAIQTVERDPDTLEVTRTVTTYETDQPKE
jgi:phage gp29-like protein